MEETPKVECSFLIPIVRNSDRELHQPITWGLLHNALYREFQGWTGPAIFRAVQTVRGGWVPPGAHAPIEDENNQYVVAVPEDRVDALRALLRKAANSFDQQSIYLSVRGYVEYVQPTPADGFLE